MSEVHFTDQNFSEEVLGYQGTVLVDFWAAWCGPCRIQGPIIEQLANEYDGKEGVKIGKLNVDENQETAQKYGIMSIPTIMVFKNGQPVGQLVGVQTKEALKQAMK